MPEDRYIPDEVIDALVEWCIVNAPYVVELPGFMKGLFVITDDAIRDAVEKERERALREVHQSSPN